MILSFSSYKYTVGAAGQPGKGSSLRVLQSGDLSELWAAQSAVPMGASLGDSLSRDSTAHWGAVCLEGGGRPAGGRGLMSRWWACWAGDYRLPGPGGWDKVFGNPSVLLTILCMKVKIQGQRKAALTHIYIKNKSLNYLSSFAWGLSFYVPAPLRSISVRIKSYSPLGYVCGVVKNTDAKLTGCGTQQLIELIMTRSDLFLISNYVHLGCAGYMILVLMMASVVGLLISPFLTQDYKWGGRRHCMTPQIKFQGPSRRVSLMATG